MSCQVVPDCRLGLDSRLFKENIDKCRSVPRWLGDFRVGVTVVFVGWIGLKPVRGDY